MSDNLVCIVQGLTASWTLRTTRGKHGVPDPVLTLSGMAVGSGMQQAGNLDFVGAGAIQRLRDACTAALFQGGLTFDQIKAQTERAEPEEAR